MGKLGRAFGLGKKGKIGISVEKPSYVAGEVVRGTIYVEVYEPIQCDGASYSDAISVYVHVYMRLTMCMRLL